MKIAFLPGLLILIAFLFLTPLSASPIVPSLSGVNDMAYVDWGIIGPESQYLTSNAPLFAGADLTVSLQTPMIRNDAGNLWDDTTSPFSAGTRLLRTMGLSFATVVIDFSRSVLAAGLHIESETPGLFEATAETYNDGYYVGTYVVDGFRGGNLPVIPYLSAYDDGGFNRLVIHVNTGNFAIDGLRIGLGSENSPETVPEPMTMTCIGVGLIAIFVAHRRVSGARR